MEKVVENGEEKDERGQRSPEFLFSPETRCSNMPLDIRAASSKFTRCSDMSSPLGPLMRPRLLVSGPAYYSTFPAILG